jgi:hypothetical protein
VGLFAKSSSLFAGFCENTVCSTESARLIKSALLATKSVSQLISTIIPVFLSSDIFIKTKPSLADFSALLAATAAPFFLRISMAFSKSPSDSMRAFLLILWK